MPSERAVSEIRKVLSANDVGATGAHQAGIVVPKDKEVLSFFPRLDVQRKNPDSRISVKDELSGMHWELRFVYYNGRTLGDGTRNEYRLTHMTGMLRHLGARQGDTLVFTRTVLGDILVGLEPAAVPARATSLVGKQLPGGWTIVSVEDK